MDGLADLAEEFSFHLRDNRLALQQLALTAKVFSHPARKILFKEFKIMNKNDVYQWRLRLAQFAGYIRPRAIQPVFSFVKDLYFSLNMGHFRYTTYAVELLDDIRDMLTRLKAVHIFGYNGLYDNWPRHAWFGQFINSTKPETLSFNGMLVPRYILRFEFPSVRVIHFNICRIYYCDEDLRPSGHFQPTLNAQVILRGQGKKWKRVEGFISNAINGETLQLLRCAADMDILGLRGKPCSLYVNSCSDLLRSLVTVQQDLGLPKMQVPLSLRKVSLQVPVTYVQSLPEFVRKLMWRTPYLERLEILYEPGWHRHFGEEDLILAVMEGLLSSVRAMEITSLKEVCFHLKVGVLRPEQSGVTFWERKMHGVGVEAKLEFERLLVFSDPLPSDYHMPFIEKLAYLWN